MALYGNLYQAYPGHTMLITRSKVAAIFDISGPTVLRWVDRGLLPEPIRYGSGRYRGWDYEEIMKWKANLHPKSTPPASSAAARLSECVPQSKDSSGKPDSS